MHYAWRANFLPREITLLKLTPILGLFKKFTLNNYIKLFISRGNCNLNQKNDKI